MLVITYCLYLDILSPSLRSCLGGSRSYLDFYT